MSLRILRGFTLIADDDKNLHLEIDELKLPTLEEKSVDFTPGGSTGETDVPLGITSKLEIPFKLISHNPLIDVLFGRHPACAPHSPAGSPCLMMRMTPVVLSRRRLMSGAG